MLQNVATFDVWQCLRLSHNNVMVMFNISLYYYYIVSMFQYIYIYLEGLGLLSSLPLTHAKTIKLGFNPRLVLYIAQHLQHCNITKKSEVLCGLQPNTLCNITRNNPKHYPHFHQL